MFSGKEIPMGSGGRRWTLWLLPAALVLGIVAPAAAQEIDNSDIIAPQHKPPQVGDGWQAGTCYSDPPCTVATPEEFFEQSSGHPQVGFTQFIIKQEAAPIIGEIPVGNLKTVRVDLPVGLSVNPQATPEQCDLEAVEHPESCPADTKVGVSEVTATNPLTGFSLTLPAINVYNLIPRPGEPARFGLTIVGNDIFLDAGVAWDGDYHEFFTIDVAKLSLGPGLEVARILKNRLVFEGRAGNGTFITTPSTCYDHESAPYEHVYSTFLRADSYEHEDLSFPTGSPLIESELPPDTNPKECGSVPFDPSIDVSPDTAQTDSPSGPAVRVQVPFEVPSAEEKLQPRTKQASSDVRSARVTLPRGMGLNPSAANGLQTCGDAQFGLHTRNPVSCPPGSKIGTVAIDTPPLPDGSLTGTVYVAQQLSRNPLSGDEYRIFVDAESTRYGVSVRLAGHVAADPDTGVLTTTFDDSQFAGLPQVPFSSFTLDFDGGAHAVLTSPPTCGPNQTTSRITPWSGNADATPGSRFTLSSAPGGGACAPSLGARPFGPSFAAHSTNPKGGAYTQVNVNIGRDDGNQELKGVDVTLPPGLTAKLAGVRYCPPSALATAAANSGAAEAAHSSCPDSSLVGSASIAAGSGSDPVHITGEVFLTGRYRGAPLSLAVITPATAGPFDLGSVVVRVALFVDPSTAQVTASSDPIPHVYGGAKLDIRSIAVHVNRKRFALNPTNCAPMPFTGTLHGGGSNPLDQGAFSSLAVSSPFQVNACEALPFQPKLYMRAFGAHRRAKSPKLRAILVARDGDANVGRAAVTLPKALYLEQASLANVCTRVQFAAHNCPKNSIYGFASAYTPLLDGPLKGPVYLRSSDNELPDMVAALHGQVDVELDGRIDSVKGRIRNTFDTVPDVPVSKFILTVRGGKHGLLVNSRDLCAHRYKVVARFRGQNGKHANMRPKLRAPCKTKKRHRRHHRHKPQRH